MINVELKGYLKSWTLNWKTFLRPQTFLFQAAEPGPNTIQVLNSENNSDLDLDSQQYL